jgi:hypothetical protein
VFPGKNATTPCAPEPFTVPLSSFDFLPKKRYSSERGGYIMKNPAALNRPANGRKFSASATSCTINLQKGKMMKKGISILLLFLCFFILNSCDITPEDELLEVEWDVYRMDVINEHKVNLGFKTTVDFNDYGSNRGYYSAYLDREKELNTNKIVFINGKPIPGMGGGIFLRIITIIPEEPVKQGDIITFDHSWFFVSISKPDFGSKTHWFKVKIITESIKVP